MTARVEKLAAEVAGLSTNERNELRHWLDHYENRSRAYASPAVVPWPDLKMRLSETWGETAPASENTVLALREMERF